jgi:hypothetical protein
VSYNSPRVVDWHRFDPAEWNIEYDIDKLAAHQIADWEAAEVNLERLRRETEREEAWREPISTPRANGCRTPTQTDHSCLR